MPKNHQYLLPRIKDLLGQKEEKKEPEKATSLTPKEEVHLEILKEKLRSADLEPEQVKTFNEKKKLFLSKGFNELEAIQEAIDYARIDVNAVRQDQPKIKTGGQPKTSEVKFTGTEDTSKMSRRELADYIAHTRAMAGK